MAQGKIKWFNSQKGFGFVEQDSGPDLFVHYTAIVSEGFKSLNEGDVIEYSVSSGPKGETAVDVKVITANPVSHEKQAQPNRTVRTNKKRQDDGKPFNRSLEDQLKALRKSSKENQQDLANRLKRR